MGRLADAANSYRYSSRRRSRRKDMMSETVVITGGAGFLGSHLSERLLADGCRVICLDNFCTGTPDNVAHLTGNPAFRLIKYDVSGYLHVGEPVDAVLHFASPASPPDYLELPVETLKVGSIGTMHALGLARAKGARFLLASTSEVYGDPLVHPQGEDYWGNVNPVGPRSVYDEAKRFSEALTVAYLVEGIVRMLWSPHAGPVNLGNPTELTMLELAETIRRMTGSQSPIQHVPLPQDDPMVRRPRIDLAGELLGWKPEIGLEDGLTRTIDWFRGHPEVIN